MLLSSIEIRSIKEFFPETSFMNEMREDQHYKFVKSASLFFIHWVDHMKALQLILLLTILRCCSLKSNAEKIHKCRKYFQHHCKDICKRLIVSKVFCKLEHLVPNCLFAELWGMLKKKKFVLVMAKLTRTNVV